MPDPISATIGAVGSLGGAAISARGARKAAGAQTQAAEQASQVQREIFERQAELQEPFRQAGMTAQNELLRMLGLGGEAGVAVGGVVAAADGLDLASAGVGLERAAARARAGQGHLRVAEVGLGAVAFAHRAG